MSTLTSFTGLNASASVFSCMDLSQQELPLTSYFLRATKGNKPADHPSRKRKLNTTHDAATVQNKRTKAKDAHASLGQCTPDNRSVRRAKARTGSNHLPTPETAVRKRPAVPAAQRTGDASPVPQVNREAAGQSPTTRKEPIMLCEIDLTLSDSDDKPLEVPPQSKRPKRVHEARHSPAIRSLPAPLSSNEVARLYTGLATPATNVRKTVPSRTFLPVSPTAARRVPAHKFAGIPPLPSVVRISSARLLPRASPLSPTRARSSKSTSGVFTDEVPASSSEPLPCHRADSGLHLSDRSESDNSSNSMVNEYSPGPSGRRNVYQSSSVVSSKSDTPTEVNIPVQAVASSQSQYLLSIEATPKRNRSRRYDNLVPGSQTQEECELFIGMQPFPTANRAAWISAGNQETDETSRTLSNSVHTPGVSGATSNASSEGTQQLFSTPPLSRSPAQCGKVYQRRLRARSCSPPSNALSREGSTVVPSTLGDGSATEPESDNEILQCVAQIGRKRAGPAPSSSLRGRVPRPLVSPLVSPVRRRYTPEPSVSGSLEAVMEDEAGPSVPTYDVLSRFDGRRLRRQSDASDSFPSVVRDFMDMFKGDGSYPDDFPNSLRV
ncbi:hypothetical protein EDD17DRAFT_1754821 [Pisolithus thermaeus]|nr:hypothetical protein EDD17DRAFT_1754821 [Pisolithus thermaeus]